MADETATEAAVGAAAGQVPAEQATAETQPAAQPAAQPQVAPQRVPLWRNLTLLAWIRWCALVVWAAAFARDMSVNGIPYYRSDLLLWLGLGLIAASIGKRAVWTVVVDFVPFAAVLVAYDYLRGVSDTLGMPTWWQPQLDVDRFLFFGAEPTVWLQERIKYPHTQWWEVAVSLTYVSFFFLPYVTAAVLWLRGRAEFGRWATRFVTLSFLGFAFFALIPAAPPWAAAACTSANVADHPPSPSCLGYSPRYTDGGMLGAFNQHLAGAHPWVERLSGRGFGELHLRFAGAVIKAGQSGVDLVAAVPSLHAGGTMLFVLFFWRRSTHWVRAVLACYALFMGFTLVYTAEHYVADVLAGWVCAVVISVAFGELERRRKRAKQADTLKGTDSLKGNRPAPPTPSRMENDKCPPTTATSTSATPSST